MNSIENLHNTLKKKPKLWWKIHLYLHLLLIVIIHTLYLMVLSYLFCHISGDVTVIFKKDPNWEIENYLIIMVNVSSSDKDPPHHVIISLNEEKVDLPVNQVLKYNTRYCNFFEPGSVWPAAEASWSVVRIIYKCTVKLHLMVGLLGYKSLGPC